RTDGRLTVRLMREMAGATAMAKLPEDHPAMVMNLFGHMTPRLDLDGRVEARLERPGARPRADGDAACNNEPGARALREIARRVGLRRPVAVSRPRALHRRHDNAVLEVDGAQIIGLEQGGHGNRSIGELMLR